MVYIFLGVLAIIFFELTGRLLLSFLNEKYEIFAFPVGFIFVIGISYFLTSILTALNCSFYLLSFIYSIILLLLLFLFFKKRKEISYKINFGDWFVILICVSILIVYSANTTFGELNGFDTTHYLNLVTGNIGMEHMNCKDPIHNEIVDVSAYGYAYTFQSYYYLSSFVFGLFSKIFSLIGVKFYTPIAFTWVFQIMFHALFVSLILESLTRFLKKDYMLYSAVIGIFIFTYGRLYYNSVFGFYGNSLRTLVIGWLSLYTINYFEVQNKKNRFLISIACLAACSLSSSAVFIVVFYLFALFFIDYQNNKNIFKWYAVIFVIPSINLFTIITGNIFYSFVFAFLIFLVLYCANDILYKLFSNKKIRNLLLIFCIFLTFSLSLRVEPDLFNFGAFFDNLSEKYDMTLDYFDFSNGYISIKLFKLFSLSLLFYNLVICNKNKYIKFVLILIAVFFNPFCCKILNEVNSVYYRAYDLIFNPALIIYYLSNVRIKYQCLSRNVCALIFLMMIIVDSPFKCLYYHDTFIPTKDYNVFLKMENDEINIIDQIKNDSIYRKIENPYIVTPNLLTQSMIPYGHYIYGREYRINENWDKNEYQIYSMFWPTSYQGDIQPPKDADYDNMCQYINKSKIDYLVQDKNTNYYEEEKDVWYSMTYVIDRCGTYPFYENDNYALYYFGDK